MIYDTLIIGGGAAGLMAASELAGAKLKVALLEAQQRVGRKLAATGNGRCNFTNLNAGPDSYGNGGYFSGILEKYDGVAIMEKFNELGIPAEVDAEGRAYPMSNQAASVLDALRYGAEERGTVILTECRVTGLESDGDTVRLHTSMGDFQGRSCLVASGGAAAPKLGADAEFLRRLKDAGCRIVPLSPALSPLKTETAGIKALKGIRARCRVGLSVDGKEVASEYGEVIFSDYGISGIAVMQMSRAAGVHLSRRRKVSLKLDFARTNPRETAVIDLKARAKSMPLRRLEDFLNGIVPRRLGQAVTAMAGVGPQSRTVSDVGEAELERLEYCLRNFEGQVLKVMGFEYAQVTSGGLATDELDPESLEIVRLPGVYAAGEAIDVDGVCGGYNLHWAWASALAASDAIIKKIKDMCL